MSFSTVEIYAIYHAELFFAKRKEAELLSEGVISELRLPDLEPFKMNRRKRAFGIATYRPATKKYSVQLSKYIADETFEQIVDTVRHEFAHIIAGLNNGHNSHWKKIAKELDAKPERCASKSLDAAAKDFRYKVINRETGEVFARYHRRPTSIRASSYIRGRRNETLGKLAVVPV